MAHSVAVDTNKDESDTERERESATRGKARLRKNVNHIESSSYPLQHLQHQRAHNSGRL